MLFESFTTPKPARPPIGPIQEGDILVKSTDDSWINRGISLAQITSGAGLYSMFTHAGIAVSARTIAEMDGKGLQHHDLAVGNAGYRYSVYRSRFGNLASGAAETAKMLYGFRDSGLLTYTIAGAGKSVLRSEEKSRDKNRINEVLDRLLGGKEVEFFCSEFVVFCYLVALEQSGLLPARLRSDLPGLQTFFAYEPRHYSPAYLYEMLRKAQWFEYIGVYKGMRWV